MTDKKKDVAVFKEAVVRSIEKYYSSIKVNDKGEFKADGLLTVTSGGNLVAKMKVSRSLTFLNTRKKEFNALNGTTITAPEFAEKVRKFTTLKELFTSFKGSLDDKGINRNAGFVVRAIRTTFGLDANQTFNHADIMRILKASSGFAVKAYVPVVVKAADKKVEKEVAAKAEKPKKQKAPAAEVQAAA